jgi:oleandomycin transport system permease protein
MRQIQAVFSKTIKEFYRNKTIIFWNVAWPIIFLFLSFFIFLRAVPKEAMAATRGGYTISMIFFSVMISGMGSIPGIIAEDRARGLFLKLRSMPISQWKDLIGRILGLILFSITSAAIIGILGFAFGGKFSLTTGGTFASLGFLILAILASSGIGIIIGTFIKNVNGATITGIALAVVTSNLSGMTFPFFMLPKALQVFSKFYPISSANSIIVYLLAGKDVAGYNPINSLQLTYTIGISLLIFIISIVLYSRFCWRTE